MQAYTSWIVSKAKAAYLNVTETELKVLDVSAIAPLVHVCMVIITPTTGNERAALGTAWGRHDR